MLEMNIKYPFNLTFLDYPDDNSIALLIYMMGCDVNCKGCHNIDFQNPNLRTNDNKIINIETLISEIKHFKKNFGVNKIVLSGGDPLSKWNIAFTQTLLMMLHHKFYFMIYTGHHIDYVKEMDIKYYDFIKCNNYDITKHQISEKTDDYMKFASTNQELYDNRYNLLSRNGVFTFKQLAW